MLEDIIKKVNTLLDAVDGVINAPGVLTFELEVKRLPAAIGYSIAYTEGPRGTQSKECRATIRVDLHFSSDPKAYVVQNPVIVPKVCRALWGRNTLGDGVRIEGQIETIGEPHLIGPREDVAYSMLQQLEFEVVWEEPAA